MWVPPADGKWPYSISKAQPGPEYAIATLQLNLRRATDTYLTVDGTFGTFTDSAVRNWQLAHKLAVDGIAGRATCLSVATTIGSPITGSVRLPYKLLTGIAEQESGYILWATNRNMADGKATSWDLGFIQRNVPAGQMSEDRCREALDCRNQISQTSIDLRAGHERYFGDPGAKTHRRAWELAALLHNWPAMAGTMAQGGQPSTQPAQWVITATGGRLTSAAQWVADYIARTTKYAAERYATDVDWPG